MKFKFKWIKFDGHTPTFICLHINHSHATGAKLSSFKRDHMAHKGQNIIKYLALYRKSLPISSLKPCAASVPEWEALHFNSDLFAPGIFFNVKGLIFVEAILFIESSSLPKKLYSWPLNNMGLSCTGPLFWFVCFVLFWPHRAACGVFVPQPQIEPGPQQWKH